jgi:hypothetical protein
MSHQTQQDGGHGAAKTVKLSHRLTKPKPAELLYKPAPVAFVMRRLVVE